MNMSGTPTTDRVCKSLHRCGAKEFEDTAPTATTDRTCKFLSQCTATQYEHRAPTRTTDRRCVDHSVCTSGQFERHKPTATTDRQCKVLSEDNEAVCAFLQKHGLDILPAPALLRRADRVRAPSAEFV